MNLIKLPRPSMALTSAITWALVITIYPSQVWAQSSRPINTIPSNLRLRLSQPNQAKQEEPDFSGDGRPGRRAGGGSRSPCLPMELPLTALMPATNSGKTIAERPTFWFYVPYSPQEARSGEFVLQNEKNDDVSRTPFTLPKTPGFVSFSIPPTQPGLEIKKWYRWYFKLYCDPQKLSGSDFVEGWVQRIELTTALDTQLKAAKPQEYIAYASNLIWYDALDRLAQLRLTKPPNATLDNDWADLLKLRGVGSERLNRKPMIGSVNIIRN